MTRDPELYLKLLRHFESQKAGSQIIALPAEEFGCTPHELVEHLELMIEQGLVRGEAETRWHIPNGGTFCIRRLTAAGHDFLDSTRDPTIWAKAKERVLKPGMSWTFSILVDYLKAEATHRLGSLLGLPPAP